MGEDIVRTLRKENLVLMACGITVLAATLAVDIGSIPLIVAFGAASIVAFIIGLQRGTVWYKAGHWTPIAVMGAIIALTPDGSLPEVSALIVIVGIIDHVFIPIYHQMEKLGENVLR